MTIINTTDSSCNIEWAKQYGTDIHDVVRDEINHVQVAAWVHGVPVEDEVWTQVRNIAAVPGVERIAIMPDCHVGNGACVGSAILTRDVIIPAAVGVDIGCGMIATPLNLTVKDVQPYLKQIRAEIERRVPVGRTANGGSGDRGAWGTVPDDVAARFSKKLAHEYEWISTEHPELRFDRVVNQFATLGTGNHFIEVQFNLDGKKAGESYHAQVWVMLHSGSRGIGNRIGTTFTKLARQEMDRWHINLPDPSLAFLPVDSKLGQEYLQAMTWAQDYAMESRKMMFAHVLEALSTTLHYGVCPSFVDSVIHVPHNYVQHERHFGSYGYVTRKGAINASLGQLGIIPSSMGTHSFITSGLGNLESLNTSSHGAGRVMSRTRARKEISPERHELALKGIECRQDQDVIDESPAAYKDIDAVMEAQRELTRPVIRVKQLVVVKG